ncbi:MAG: hypothetical protein WDN26_24255 [Chitinophagaceae bacterium]
MFSTFKGQPAQSAIHVTGGFSAGATINIGNAVFKTAGGADITDNFAKEDLITHAIDAPDRALLIWMQTMCMLHLAVLKLLLQLLLPYSVVLLQQVMDLR